LTVLWTVNFGLVFARLRHVVFRSCSTAEWTNNAGVYLCYMYTLVFVSSIVGVYTLPQSYFLSGDKSPYSTVTNPLAASLLSSSSPWISLLSGYNRLVRRSSIERPSHKEWTRTARRWFRGRVTTYNSTTTLRAGFGSLGLWSGAFTTHNQTDIHRPPQDGISRKRLRNVIAQSFSPRY